MEAPFKQYYVAVSDDSLKLVLLLAFAIAE